MTVHLNRLLGSRSLQLSNYWVQNCTGQVPAARARDADEAEVKVDGWLRRQSYNGSGGHAEAVQGMLAGVRRTAVEARALALEQVRKVKWQRAGGGGRGSCQGTIGDWCGPYHEQALLPPKVVAPACSLHTAETAIYSDTRWR